MLLTLSLLPLVVALQNNIKLINITINNAKPCFLTDQRFLSNALDTAFLRRGLNLNSTVWGKLTGLLKPLSPGYLRLGGNDADLALFRNRNFTVTEKMWVRINKFARNSGTRLIFDVNVLFRHGSHWDPTNAVKMLNLTEKHNFKMDFQLGNEPDSFHHRFNQTISPEKLAGDYKSFREIIHSRQYFQDSLLIGPEVTRPRKTLVAPSITYLKKFLNAGGGNAVDAVSWHQYYLNGRTATVPDFLNPAVMDVLTWQVRAVVGTVKNKAPVWLSETGSAYGGGAPGLSDRFVSVFLFVDKLGTAAKNGVSVIIRQSLLRGHYSLIDGTFVPNPDYWISLIFKQIVGNKVYCSYSLLSFGNVRLYVHSARRNLPCVSNPYLTPSLVVFGVNLADEVSVNGLENYEKCAVYQFTGELQSKDVFLNGIPLNWTVVEPDYATFFRTYASVDQKNWLPGISVVFWVLSPRK